MDLTRYVDELRDELLTAAEAGGDEARALAERLVAPLQSAVRMMLLDALSAAAGEITSDLAPGSVEVRLRGRDPEFVVTSPPIDAPADAPAATEPVPTTAPPASDADEGQLSRVTLRLPESLKARVDDAAARSGVSVNSWLVRTIAGAVDPGADTSGYGVPRRSSFGGDGFTGWTRS